MRLSELTWPEAAGNGAPVLCVPIGACEQHGPHLPLSTDTFIAEALAARLAERRPAVVIAPAIAISASGEHAGFAGTLSIGTDVMTTVIVELVRSADWASGVILLNAHGGNRWAVERAVAQLRADGRDVLSWWPRIPGGDAHAGRTETALMLAIRPDLVRTERAESGESTPIDELLARLLTDGVRAVSTNGVLGDPAGADAAEGRVILDALTDDLVAAVDGWLVPQAAP